MSYTKNTNPIEILDTGTGEKKRYKDEESLVAEIIQRSSSPFDYPVWKDSSTHNDREVASIFYYDRIKDRVVRLHLTRNKQSTNTNATTTFVQN